MVPNFLRYFADNCIPVTGNLKLPAVFLLMRFPNMHSQGCILSMRKVYFFILGNRDCFLYSAFSQGDSHGEMLFST